jgi:hypothetical protein
VSERDLYAAAVEIAAHDLDTEPYGSTDYAQSVLFFTAASGEWADSREAIADQLGLHGDDLARLGARAIAARHLRDGGPKVRVPTPYEGPTSCPVPRLTNPAPGVTKRRPGIARAPLGKRALKQAWMAERAA